MIYTTLGPNPQRTNILPVELEDNAPERVGTGTRHACELLVHPEHALPPLPKAGGKTARRGGLDPESAGL